MAQAQLRMGSAAIARPVPVTPCLAMPSPSTSGRPASQPLSTARVSQPPGAGRASLLVLNAAGRRAGRSSVASSLVAVLKDEIKYERESYRRDELILSGPPNDFELADEPGTSAFLLAKQFGAEEILVRVNVDAQPEYDEEEEDEEYEDEETDSRPVEFQVTIGKEDGDDVLIFECESDGEYLTINSVSLDHMDDEDEPGAPGYRGPAFIDLDDTLQQAFVDYLEERGVNAYLGEFIRVYLQDKASLEYQSWLGRVRDFIGK